MCKECENCVVVMVVCVAARAGELMNVLTNCGVGVVFGTVTSIQVASHRPNPAALVQEFRDFDFESPWEGARAAGLLNDDVLPGDEKASAAEDAQGQEG